MLSTLFIRRSLETMGAAKPTQGFREGLRMRLHRNAKTTPKMRQLLIDRVTHHGWTQAAAATAARDQRAHRGQVDRARATRGRAARGCVVAAASPAADTRQGSDDRHPGLSPAAGD